MEKDVQQMWLGACKWSVVAIVAAIAFYQAVPKYYFISKCGIWRCNQVTGKVQEATARDECGGLIYGTRIPKEKKASVAKKTKAKKEEVPDFYSVIEDEDDYDPRERDPADYARGR